MKTNRLCLLLFHVCFVTMEASLLEDRVSILWTLKWRRVFSRTMQRHVGYQISTDLESLLLFISPSGGTFSAYPTLTYISSL